MNKEELPTGLKILNGLVEGIGWALVAGQAIFTGMLIIGAVLLIGVVIGFKTMGVIVGLWLLFLLVVHLKD